MATFCHRELDIDGFSGKSKLNGHQSGVMVAPGELPQVVHRHFTEAVHPSDDCDTNLCVPILQASTKTPPNTSELSSNDLESDATNISFQQQHLQSTPQQRPWQQTQQLVPRPQTNVSNSQDVNNASTLTQTNSSGPSTPKYPNFSTVPQRLKSFGAVVLAVSTQLLSVAGFYLVRNGGEDATRCYHCGIGLRHWSPEDDPWVEHARFSPKCEYLLTMKGQEFVNLIQLAVKYSFNTANSSTNQLGNTLSSSNNNNCSSEANVSKTRQDLVRENAELRSITKCTFCDCKEVSLVFLPCGHLISCEACGKEQRICRICNQSIKGTVRTFRASNHAYELYE
ncbi:putative inhibitor of apoptosis isoform X2 [Dreissena polymorpha]|uniref:putative inhibitor of apoptosis isoform X2 n=1 Tax=Dreissena polymorpha TaxID=45954 RepID=UPI00226452E3|nr:putative inhibitor of apoptosis isoform X2 [Dreissena polymorpha]XP_052251193.1 putative inhibitor of apoptosis isoform X2 [Dreissena polymorpha]